MVNVFAAHFFLGWEFVFAKLCSAFVGDRVDNGVWIVPLSGLSRY